MKKHYTILFIICSVVLIFLFLEPHFVVKYQPSTTFNTMQLAEDKGTQKHLEISFDFEPQSILGSNQIAVWIEDENGQLVKTLAVTQYTSTGGWRLRKNALPYWVDVANPDSMSVEEIDAISSVTPRQKGTYRLVWDFTDNAGNPVTDEIYYCHVEATLYFLDHVMFIAQIQSENEITEVQPSGYYRNISSQHKDMLRNVHITYYPEGLR